MGKTECYLQYRGEFHILLLMTLTFDLLIHNHTGIKNLTNEMKLWRCMKCQNSIPRDQPNQNKDIKVADSFLFCQVIFFSKNREIDNLDGLGDYYVPPLWVHKIKSKCILQPLLFQHFLYFYFTSTLFRKERNPYISY